MASATPTKHQYVSTYNQQVGEVKYRIALASRLIKSDLINILESRYRITSATPSNLQSLSKGSQS